MELGISLGLRVNAGHGINYDVEGAKTLDQVCKYNIGRSIISRSLSHGLAEAVQTIAGCERTTRHSLNQRPWRGDRSDRGNRIRVPSTSMGLFLNKIFSSAEQAYCMEKANFAPFGARFAAKESGFQGLRNGVWPLIGWMRVKRRRRTTFLRFSEKGRALLEKKGANEALVSLTHLESIASAIVVLVSS